VTRRPLLNVMLAFVSTPPLCIVDIYVDYSYLYVFYARNVFLMIILLSFYQTVTVTCTLDRSYQRKKVFPWNQTQCLLSGRIRHRT
jgi:hypothetical protein